jgi:hypothetical protein
MGILALDAFLIEPFDYGLIHHHPLKAILCFSGGAGTKNLNFFTERRVGIEEFSIRKTRREEH